MILFPDYDAAEEAFYAAAAKDLRWELEHCYAVHIVTGRGAVLTLPELWAGRDWIEPRTTMGPLQRCSAGCGRLVVGKACYDHADAIFDR